MMRDPEAEKIWQFQMFKNWEAAAPEPIQSFSFAICVSAKFLLPIELIQMDWPGHASAWIF